MIFRTRMSHVFIRMGGRPWAQHGICQYRNKSRYGGRFRLRQSAVGGTVKGDSARGLTCQLSGGVGKFKKRP